MTIINKFDKSYESFLNDLENDLKTNNNVEELYYAVKYQLENPGKQLRPRLMLLIAEDLFVEYDEIKPFALALELIHNYSLIHDDLPAMDNDDYRRGRLTIHKKFSEATAILAGDYLLNKSFQIVAETNLSNATKQLTAINYLASKSCDFGMIGGQIIDMNPKNIQTFDDLLKMYEYKTGSLFKISFAVPGILSSNTQINIDKLEEIGKLFGLYFQIKDDFSDIEEDEKVDKTTIFTFKNKAEAEAIMNNYLNILIKEAKEAKLYKTLEFIEEIA